MYMKKVLNIFSALALSALTMTSCVEETFPEDGSATSDQIGASATALEAAVNGIPSKMVQGYLVYGDQVHESDLSYPQFMIAQTEMLGDMYPLGDNSGYDWFSEYNTFHRNFGENSYYAYLAWFTLYQLVKASNEVLSSVDITDESLSNEIKGLAGIAYASRAFQYYMLMVLFEPVENNYTDISKVKGLTVPIITEKTTSEEAKNNPRVPREQLLEFILSDLDNAEKCLANYTPSSDLFPDLAVVYGIKAKVYLWNEQYDKAAEYARKAIDESGASPVTAEQWEDPITGFNTANQAWMWYLHYSNDNMGNLANFTGHIAGEADWGYSQLSMPGIDRSLYDAIADDDFRKHSFIDPQKTGYYAYKSVRGDEWIEAARPYQSIKFRCGSGDYKTYSVGAAVDVPVMRVEEMFFIEAEAVGMSQGVAAGVAKLNSFMQSYRQPSYNFATTDARTFQLEVLKQMRIEFWGEGNAFPSAKRIKPDIIQNYEGTNAPNDYFKINCKGIKPNWNLLFPVFESDANNALKGLNNPDPTATVVGPTPIGEFAPSKNAAQ